MILSRKKIKIFNTTLSNIGPIWIILGIGLIALNCSKKVPEQPDQLVLAKIGDRILTVEEFLKRSEYNIRPVYCKMDNYIHKKIVLNSLVAEKLFAFEAGENNQLTKSPAFQNYIKGRKEQDMRKWLFKEEGLEKAQVDTNKIKKAFRYAGREYEIAYFTVNSDSVAKDIHNKINSKNYTFEKVFNEILPLGKLPKRTVQWEKEENPVIHEALFSDDLKVGQVIGPLNAEDKVYTTIKILSWTDKPAITDEQIKQRWRDVKQKLLRQESNKVYTKFVLNLMKGKEVKFNGDVLFKLADIVKPFYLFTSSDKEEAFKQGYWEKGKQDKIPKDEIENNFKEINDQPLLTINGQIWTVANLRDEISLHPLVFRKRNINNSEFPEQLKFAIVDLIRDKYITKEAYQRGYDKINTVIQDTDMWQDYALSLFQREKYLESVGNEYDFSTDYMKAINKYLNAYVDSLQVKYSDQIEINMKIFEKLKLTRIDMFVMDQNVPYPTVVPGFPILTTEHKLDYGREMP